MYTPNSFDNRASLIFLVGIVLLIMYKGTPDKKLDHPNGYINVY